jgi:Leucine-rich repeat (LRR) protein
MSSKRVVGLLLALMAIPLLIYMKRRLAQPARVVLPCPEECRCESGTYRVSCPMSSLNDIASNFLKTIREFHLDGKSIPSLKKDNYISKGLTELEVLSLNSCGMETIELGAFNGLTKLIYLSLRSNMLSEIIPGTFEDLCSLEYLDLHNNIIGRLEVDVFSGLINLKYLFLTNNKLASVHPDVFIGLPKLRMLFLMNNPGLQIPNGSHFINSHSLKLLCISGCNVSSVSVETFANVTALELLDLGYNNLRNVNINILKVLPKLSELYLYENPLQCDCQLQEVWRWCQDHDIKTVFAGKGPHCIIPNQGNSLPWEVLEKRQCLQENIKNHADYEHKRYRRAENEYERANEKSTYYEQQIIVQVYAVLFIFGISSNTILLIIIMCNKNMCTNTNMYIFNLAIADLIILTHLFSIALDEMHSVKLSLVHAYIILVLSTFFYRLSVGLSAYSVALLSIYRYRVTVNHSQVRVSSQISWRAALANLRRLWIVATLFALPSAFLMIMTPMYETLLFITYYKYVVSFEFVVFCVLPLCMIVFSYIMTARHQVNSYAFMSERSQRRQLNIRKIIKKIMLGLTVVFLTSYVPYQTLSTYSYCTFKWVSGFVVWSYEMWLLFEFSKFFLLINCCLNPVALFCTSRSFRKHLKRYLTCCCKAKPPSHLELTIRN